MRRSAGSPGIALDHAVLHLDGAAHGVDHATKFDKRAIACPLHDAPMMHGDGRINQVALERPQSRQCAILIGACQSAIPNPIRRQDRRKFWDWP